jgi:Zn-dependent peptidase ImmA (M78 family)
METLRVGGRKYSDPDVISLIRATGQLVDPRSAVVNQARKLNHEYRSYDGAKVSPLKRLELIASICGLTMSPMNIEPRRAEPRDAVLLLNGNPRGNRGQILYNPQRPQGRVAFSIAHEIGHTFFPNTMKGARFRDICGSDSREANELERLCDLAASELLMPIEEFTGELNGFFTLANVEKLADRFGGSFEATAFRLATAHPGFAVAGLLRYRLRKGEERALATSSEQFLFHNMEQAKHEAPEPKYRRQSFFSSGACRDQHTIRWNKSFDLESCVYQAAKSTDIITSVEVLPNQSSQEGVLEAVRAPFQREDAHPEFPDLLFFWSTSTTQQEEDTEVVCSPPQQILLG